MTALEILLLLLIVLPVVLLLAVPWIDKRYARKAPCDRCKRSYPTFVMYRIVYYSGRQGWLCDLCDSKYRHPSMQRRLRRG